MRDGWLSWPCWLTDSGRLNRKVASSLAQDRESSPAETSVLTTMLRRQQNDDDDNDDDRRIAANGNNADPRE